MKMLKLYAYSIICLFAFASISQGSAEAVMAPDKLVEEVTETLLNDIALYRDALNKAESEAEEAQLLSRFYDSLGATLEPVIDFNWISLNVMGPYRKQATAEQRKRFREVFTRGLVETYGRGLLTYSDEKIVVHPLEEAEQGKRKVTVIQEIKGVDKTYPLLYSMGLNRNGDWKVINVIINGINLGTTFRNQFVQAAEKYSGDVDKVIENWSITQS
ncbi:MAG: phospholipid-binding protein MlaC [Porticoccaceae bacterium]